MATMRVFYDDLLTRLTKIINKYMTSSHNTGLTQNKRKKGINGPGSQREAMVILMVFYFTYRHRHQELI